LSKFMIKIPPPAPAKKSHPRPESCPGRSRTLVGTVAVTVGGQNYCRIGKFAIKL
jgi:hypothetical protein